MQPTMLVDARVQVLASAAHGLQHNTSVDFYSGSQVVAARVRLLEGTILEPGQSGWAQLRLEKPAVLARRDRFILRIPSPSATIGGGELVDIHPRYHRRGQSAVLSALETLARGTPEELVLAVLAGPNKPVRQNPRPRRSQGEGVASPARAMIASFCFPLSWQTWRVRAIWHTM